jgi:hypothetical protein
MTSPQNKPQAPQGADPPNITIQTPHDGDTVAPAFPAGGTVSLGFANVLVRLESSKPGFPPVDNPADGSSGMWTTNFNVDPANYPGDSTLTASIVGLDVFTSITVKIRPTGGETGG